MTSRREQRSETEAAIAAAIARSGLDRRRADREVWDGGALPVRRRYAAENRARAERAIAEAARPGWHVEIVDSTLPITRPHVDAALRAGMSRRQIVDVEDITTSQHASSRAVRGESSPVPPPG